MKFKGKTIWITGASSGIGEALAVALSRKGARLVLSARRESELERVRQCCKNPAAHMVLPLDVLDTAAMPAAVEQVLARYKRIDILINNAGVSQRSLVKDTPLEIDERIMRINFLGPVALTKAVLPAMLARRRGQIVVISSVVGKIGTPMRSAYAASKHALHGYYDCMRAELHHAGIRVTLICPGYVSTEVVQNALTADGSSLGSANPVQSPGMAPEELARQALPAIAKRKAEVFIGGKELLAVQLRRFAPGLFNRIVRRMRVT